MTIQDTFRRLQDGAAQYTLTTAEQRIQRLDALWKSLLKHREAFNKAAFEELRMDEEGVMGQMMMVQGEIEFARKNLAKWMKPRRVKNSSATMLKKCYVRPQAKGVVLNISTWNAPICISFVPAIAALAAGNTVCIKPSELAPGSAEVIRQVVADAFDPSEVACVVGGVEESTQLLALPFNHIYYTGGHRVGQIVMKAAADHFAGITLEMGGKNPIIIDATADIEDAAQKSVWGRLVNGGQGCVNPDYVLVESSVAESYSAKVLQYIQSMYNSDGNGLENSPYLPCLINEQQTQRVVDLIEDAKSKGAKVLTGGVANVDKRYVEPTVLTNVSEDMEIMRNEIFGPVICILPYTTREEAVRIANIRKKSLSLYIYSRNRDNIDYFIANTESGGLCINHNVVHAGSNPNLPFGGINASGIGRIGGYRGFIEMSNERGILEQPLGWRNFNINFPPYTKFFKRAIRAPFKD